MNEKEIFTDIYNNNYWGSEESISGPGSTLDATKYIRDELLTLFKKYEIKSVLDIPCGDFNWMKFVDFSGINYVGADIVKELVEKNLKENPETKFVEMNLLEDNIPKFDLIFCRDCLFHFSFDDIKKALCNIKKSGSKYILTTSFNWKSIENIDIKMGEWRRLNLQLEPLNLPSPLDFIVEGSYLDKCLLLYKCDDLMN